MDILAAPQTLKQRKIKQWDSNKMKLKNLISILKALNCGVKVSFES